MSTVKLEMFFLCDKSPERRASAEIIDKLYPDRQYISSSQYNWTFCCPILGSRHCTCAYTEIVDPARRPSIPQVRQRSARFNSKEEAPPPLPFSLLAVYLFYGLHLGSNVVFSQAGVSSTDEADLSLYRRPIKTAVVKNYIRWVDFNSFVFTNNKFLKSNFRTICNKRN